MTRNHGFTTLCLCLGLMLPGLRAQQTPPPATPDPASGTPGAPASAPAQTTVDPGTGLPLNPGTTSGQTSAPSSTSDSINPKTGLPWTAAELRERAIEREIDKYDPMKRDVDPTKPDAAAQDPSALTDRPQPGASVVSKSAPLPGSIAASNDDASTSGAARAKAVQGGGDSGSSPSGSSDGSDSGYNGPAVLSRSYTLARPMIPTSLRWHTSFGLSYSADEGQTPTVGNGITTFESSSSQSANVTWSEGGSHVWRHDQISLSYAGSYSQYYSGTPFTGLNNSLNLSYAHAISRRMSFQIVEGVQDLSQNYTLGNPALEPGTSVANLNLATSPNVQLLNSTVHQSSTAVSFTYRQTSRLSYSLSASYFIVGRTGAVGTYGSQVSADVNYRWTKKTTVGAYYSYTNYQYTHNVANADSHGAGLIYSYALNRNTQLRTRMGGTIIENLGYAAVALPPALAAILGVSTTVIEAYSRNWTYDLSAELVRDFGRNRTASLSFAHGESPGNGVLLTSIQETISAGYSTRLIHRQLPLSLGAVYSTLIATSQGNLGNYKSETVYVSTSRPLGRGLSATFRVDYRRYDLSSTPLQQTDTRVSAGVSWSPPGDLLPF